MKYNIDQEYLKLLQDILENGVKKGDRTGTGTISVFGRTIRHSMSEGFPLLTTKRVAFKQIVSELMWFLRGETNIQWLVQNGNNIWVGDAYKAYRNAFVEGHVHQQLDKCLSQEEFIEKIKTDDEFAKKWGDLGPIYGKQWRNWETPKKCEAGVLVEFPNDDRLQWPKIVYEQIDQIQQLIDGLKKNPDSRRLMVSAWNPADVEITDYRSDDKLYEDYLKDIF